MPLVFFLKSSKILKVWWMESECFLLNEYSICLGFFLFFFISTFSNIFSWHLRLLKYSKIFFPFKRLKLVIKNLLHNFVAYAKLAIRAIRHSGIDSGQLGIDSRLTSSQLGLKSILAPLYLIWKSQLGNDSWLTRGSTYSLKKLTWESC